MSIAAGVAATAAMTRQTIALEVVKANAQADQKMANILAEAADNVAALSSRGTVLNISA